IKRFRCVPHIPVQEVVDTVDEFFVAVQESKESQDALLFCPVTFLLFRKVNDSVEVLVLGHLFQELAEPPSVNTISDLFSRHGNPARVQPLEKVEPHDRVALVAEGYDLHGPQLKL